MKMCRAEHTDQNGTVVCTKSSGHSGHHHAYDATTSFMWTDTIDEIAESRGMCPDCGCWTGGAACPYCSPGAPHPRGRS